MKNWMIVALAVLVIAGITYLGGLAWNTEPSSTQGTSGTSGNGTPSAETLESDLVLLSSWQGTTGAITTEPFTINKQPWVISWTNEPQIVNGQSIGSLQIIVYHPEQPDIPVTLAGNTLASETNSSYVYETGTFFLTIIAINSSWEVSVLKP